VNGWYFRAGLSKHLRGEDDSSLLQQLEVGKLVAAGWLKRSELIVLQSQTPELSVRVWEKADPCAEQTAEPRCVRSSAW
jgi:hypothetical protein